MNELTVMFFVATLYVLLLLLCPSARVDISFVSMQTQSSVVL